MFDEKAQFTNSIFVFLCRNYESGTISRINIVIKRLLFCSQIISYESPRGGVSVITEKGETTTSYLLIQNARPSDTGQYQCNPSNAQSKSILVHVLNGKMKHL